MKPIKKISAFLVTALAFVFLFYHTWAGVNFLVFFGLLLGINYWLRKDVLLTRKGMAYTALCLISAVAVLLKPGAFSFVAFFANVMLWSWYLIRPDTTPLVSFVVSGFNMVIAPVSAAIQLIGLGDGAQSGTFKQVLKTSIIVLLAIIAAAIFLALYEASNPIFAENMKWLTFSKIEPDLIAFILLGVVLSILVLFQTDLFGLQKVSQRFIDRYAEEESRVANPSIVLFGMVLFALLNIMLLILVIGDLPYIFGGKQLPKDINLSQFVHEGVNSLIISICLASGILLAIFHHKALPTANLKLLKTFGYVWMAQTVLTILITYYRNYLYVDGLGLTYKRVGVYYWLLLVCAGLYILFVKINKERSLGFVFNNFLLILIISFTGFACINWDRFITSYNLTRADKRVEWRYMLTELDGSNLPQLITYLKQNPVPDTQQNINVEALIDIRIAEFKISCKSYNNSWRSWNYTDYSTKKFLDENAY